MARTLEVRMLGPDGEPMPADDLGSLYAADLHFEPSPRRSEIGADGTVRIETPQPATVLHARITVPEFGTVWVVADNAGEGYDDRSGGIDFVREAARSRLARVERLLAVSGGSLSPTSRAHFDGASELLEAADRASGSQRAALHLKSLSHGLWAGELVLLESAQRSIAASELRTDFLFGCNAFFRGEHVDRLRRAFVEALNFATLPFYLRRLEPEEGKPDYARVDELLAWCEREGLTPKGHPLWWGHEAGTPAWLEGADWEAAQRHCRRVVKRSVERYRGRIGIWDAINEAHDWANGLALSQEQQVAITRIACDAVREANPDATVIVNNCLVFGEYAASGEVHLGPTFERVRTPLSYLAALAEEGVDFDVIGIQLYFPARDMLAVSDLLDEYARFGKPLHITELGVAAGRRPGSSEQESRQSLFTRGRWHQPWREQVQADWLKWFYTICYARPDVEAITWWDFADPAFIPMAGLFRENGIPKEAYLRLRALTRRWLGRR